MTATMSTRSTARQPRTVSELNDRLDAVIPLAKEQAAEADQIGQITNDVMEALQDSEVFGMWTPKSLGGSELSFSEGSALIEKASYADGGAGWIVMVHGLMSAVSGGYLGDDAVNAMYSGDRIPLVSGQGTRPGRLVPTGEGYTLTGEWNFASGIKYAQWTHNLAIVEGTGQALITTTPISAAKLDHESWDVLGLRATGSLDYSIADAYVPKDFTFDALSRSSVRGGPLYELGLIAFALAGHAGWAVGVSRRLLDELTASVASKRGRAGTIAGSDSFHERYFAAEVRHRSARALLIETWADVEETLYSGDPLSVQQETLLRAALSNVTVAAQDAARFVLDTAGTYAVRPGPIQQACRDAETGAQHMTSAPAVRRHAGRALAGLAAGQRWQNVELIDPAAK